ncbi:hypothetical protein DFQ01_10755 [Paenibacillus cellulosilyticus]|uniref:Uncharacterized protein n=1 Tax=Paenibacillus cellulosilyticus TaxID=375489 RepID=A0A2V2YUN8_9BACL|nr:hypothetical protein DFQ01_10755 [Paenibacillus cellulosilyticus]
MSRRDQKNSRRDSAKKQQGHGSQNTHSKTGDTKDSTGD